MPALPGVVGNNRQMAEWEERTKTWVGAEIRCPHLLFSALRFDRSGRKNPYFAQNGRKRYRILPQKLGATDMNASTNPRPDQHVAMGVISRSSGGENKAKYRLAGENSEGEFTEPQKYF